jgi:signal transduction histidine kinase/ligand-binding sensor domain-containing protein
MTLKPLFVFLACLFFCGCWFSNRSVPMPLNEAEFPKPVKKPLKFSAPRKVKWNVVPADSVHPGHIYPFDIDKLPSQRFNPGGLNPLPKPASVTAFHYNALPDTILNLDIIPSEPLVFKSSLLGKLKKVILGQPKLKAESYQTSFQYNDDQGFPGQSVRNTLHTREGVCWISTSGGLCSLNGESLEVFPNNYGQVFYMAEDTLGQVWLRSIENGVFIINRKSGLQKQILNFKQGVHIRIDKKGFIWVCAFDDGIYLISPDQKTFKHITTKYGLSTNAVETTFEDKDGRIWIAHDKLGVDILDPSLKKIKRLGTEKGPANNTVYNIAENKAGDIYLAGQGRGIDIINIRKETYRHLDTAQGIGKSVIYNMLEDNEGHMWLTADTLGVIILSGNADSIGHIGVHEGLGEGYVMSLDKDDQQQMFVGTVSGGLNVFPPVNRIAHHLSTKEGILDDNVWGFSEDSKHRFWIGTYSGINIITPDQKIYRLQIVPPEDRNDRTDAFLQTGPDQFAMCGINGGLILLDELKHTIEKIGLKEGLPSAKLRSILQDSQGVLYIASFNAGLISFDPKKRTIRYLNQASGLSSNIVSSVIEENPGKLWISTYGGGLDILDLKENTISTYSTKEGLSNDQSVDLLRDSKNRIWVSTEKGLNLLDPVSETNTIFSMSNGMPSTGIYSLTEKGGRFYAGTGKGLTVLKETEKTISGSKESSWNLHTYGKSLGFPFLDFNGNAVAVTQKGQFWWGIVPGITMMDESTWRPDSSQLPVQVIGMDLMGKAQYFIDPGVIKNIDTIWSDSKDTFYVRDSFDELNTDKEKGIEWESLSSLNLPVDFSLPHDLNYLRFRFGNFLPQNAGDYTYQYILDGVDESWSALTDLPYSENYNNISPGHYTFRVSARKGDGPWSRPSEFQFRIRPPWWYSWWAELLYLMIFVAAIRFWVSYRSRRLLKENARLEQKVTERTTALTNSLENLRQTQSQLIQAEKMASLGELTAGIAHEIQNPLNFVNNFSEVNTELLEEAGKALNGGDIPDVKEILKDVEMNMGKITFHGKRADAIVKGMLLHSRASSGQKIPTDVNALADEYLRLSYHGLRAKDKSFNAQFNMDLDENVGEVQLVQQDIGRVLLNLFNNAFYSVTEKKKLSPDAYQPTVTVSTKRKKNSVEISVRDNGQGIPKKVIDKIYQPFFTTKPAGQGTGLGLSLSYDIITKEHNGKIDVTTKENEFTEFIIELPAQPAA